jgi:hypothetical protein
MAVLDNLHSKMRQGDMCTKVAHAAAEGIVGPINKTQAQNMAATCKKIWSLTIR